ncbi:MAG: dockerin type I repeat-containing protein [candidate division Zixibacteria bacterium]|nr:dockerin type I repeat-containing protein [candidate division Zixibacteria bacterium]
MNKNIVANVVFTVFVSFFTFSGIFGAERPQSSSFELIKHDYISGLISIEQMRVLQVKTLFEPEKLEEKYQSESLSVIKSGTELIMTIRENWSSFDSEEKAYISQFLYRPEKDTSFISTAGYFRIYYDITGIEPVPLEDANTNDVPDYVERIALYSDSTYNAYVNLYGYLPPVIDTSGGNTYYDIYLVSIGAYGATVPEEEGDSSWNDYSSYIMMHNNFYSFPPNEDPEGDTIGAQKVTCAHEFYHAIQLAYDNDATNNLWWMEAGSTFMEEYLFSEVNDNYAYLPYFFNEPFKTLRASIGFHKYGAFIWPLYLVDIYGINILRDSWEACRANIPLDAIDSALSPLGKDVSKVFPEFTIWNYCTNVNALPEKYYPEAENYPMVDIDQYQLTLVHDSLKPVYAPDGLGCNYIDLTVDTSVHGIFEIELTGSDLARWGLSVIFSGEGGCDTSLSTIAPWNQPILFHMPFVEDYDNVIVVPSVVSKHLEDLQYSIRTKVLPYGDANNDETVNVGDAIFVINYSFKGGPEPEPIIESGDANCDGFVNIADAVRLVSFVFHGGDAPCSDR